MFARWSEHGRETRAEAKRMARYHGWWRDWQRYLTARRDLMDAKAAEVTEPVGFERVAGGGNSARALAEATLGRIPAERRTVFDRTVAATLQEVEVAGGTTRLHLDPYANEQAALAQLLRACEGDPAAAADDRWGSVPVGTNTVRLRVATLLAAPSAADYAVEEGGQSLPRSSALLVAILLCMFGGAWLAYRLGHGSTARAGVLPLTINGQAVATWELRAAVISTSAGITTTVALSPTTGTSWPPAHAGSGSGWWQPATLPLQLCLPVEHLATATALRLVAPGDLPTRSYTLSALRPARPDVVVVPCSPDPRVPARAGMLTTVSPPPSEELHVPVALDAHGTMLDVRSIQVLGAADEPALPPGQLRVVVTVAGPPTLDWNALAPRLTLQTGWSRVVAETATTPAGERQLRYLVPAFTAPLAAAWQVTLPDSDHVCRWRVTLAPPNARATLRGPTSAAEGSQVAPAPGG